MSHVRDDSLEAFRSKNYKSRLEELKNNRVFALREDGNFEIKRTPEFGMQSDVTEFAKMMDHVIKELSNKPEKNILLYHDDNSKAMKLSIDSKPSIVMTEINKKIRDQLETSEKLAHRADLECEKSSEASLLMSRLTGPSESTELMKKLTGPSEVAKLMGRLKNPPSNGISR